MSINESACIIYSIPELPAIDEVHRDQSRIMTSPHSCAVLVQIPCLGHCHRTAEQERKQQQSVTFRTKKNSENPDVTKDPNFYQAAVPFQRPVLPTHLQEPTHTPPCMFYYTGPEHSSTYTPPTTWIQRHPSWSTPSSRTWVYWPHTWMQCNEKLLQKQLSVYTGSWASDRVPVHWPHFK